MSYRITRKPKNRKPILPLQTQAKFDGCVHQTEMRSLLWVCHDTKRQETDSFAKHYQDIVAKHMNCSLRNLPLHIED